MTFWWKGCEEAYHTWLTFSLSLSLESDVTVRPAVTEAWSPGPKLSVQGLRHEQTFSFMKWWGHDLSTTGRWDL